MDGKRSRVKAPVEGCTINIHWLGVCGTGRVTKLCHHQHSVGIQSATIQYSSASVALGFCSPETLMLDTTQLVWAAKGKSMTGKGNYSGR